ncbi:MAG: DUF1653 domain-containing protein [Granulosicoccus sp.]
MENNKTLPEGAPEPGTYRHYKGPLYQVLGMAQHSETDEWMVVYQALYGPKGFWVRPLSLWLEPIDNSKVGKSGNKHATPEVRFELVTPSSRSLNQLTKPG